MTNLTEYEKGCSPSAIQRKYSLTYEQGYELAERLKKTQELEKENKKLCKKIDELYENIDIWAEELAKAEKENARLKELLRRARKHLSEQETPYSLIKRIDEVLK